MTLIFYDYPPMARDKDGFTKLDDNIYDYTWHLAQGINNEKERKQ